MHTQLSGSNNINFNFINIKNSVERSHVEIMELIPYYCKAIIIIAFFFLNNMLLLVKQKHILVCFKIHLKKNPLQNNWEN